MGAWLDQDNPARYVAAFNGQSPEARRLAKFGYASLQATSRLVQHGQRGRGMARLKLSSISLLNTALHDQCPLQESPDCPPFSSRYRTADGRCNNPAHPWWGASMMALHRFLPPHYKDGLERIRESVSGGPLPSARAVSAIIHSNRDINLTPITHMVMQWGQFLDHDLTASSQTRGFNGSVPKCCTTGGHNVQSPELTHPDCLPIMVPPDDWFYGPHGVRCLEFVRSSPTSRVGCSLGARDQINQVTSFIDASNVYGSSDAAAHRLRLYRSGLMKYKRVQYRLPLLPLSAHKADLCRETEQQRECFDAGDKRVNEQPGLIASHVMWLRVHNRLATQLAHLNPHWKDERLYQEARRIVNAMMQHITYREFLPIVLGPDVVKLFDLELAKRNYYNGYDIKVNPTAANAFGTAAFRFGHSLVQHNLWRCDRSHNKLPTNTSLFEELTIPTNLYDLGSVDKLLLGMCFQPAQKRDEFITEQLTNHLFQTPRYRYGMDLAALNIQRGRDHGLASYNTWRAPCGLQPFTEWNQLLKVMSPETQRKLRRVYRDIDDIDLFPGAMAERPVVGGLVGPTFACILAQQFSNLRRGDRFWYENGGFESSFTPAQLQQLRKITLARVLCDNLDSIDTIQPFVFLSADYDRNKHISCESEYIPNLDLTPWTEHHKYEDELYHHHHESSHGNYKPTTQPEHPYKPPTEHQHHYETSHGHYKPTTEHQHHYDISHGQYKPTTQPEHHYKPPPEHQHHYEMSHGHYKPTTEHQHHYENSHGQYKPTMEPQHHYKPTTEHQHHYENNHEHYKPTTQSQHHYKPTEHHYENNHGHYKPTTAHHHYHHHEGTTQKPFDSLPTYPLNQTLYSEFIVTHYEPDGGHHTDHTTKPPPHYHKPSTGYTTYKPKPHFEYSSTYVYEFIFEKHPPNNTESYTELPKPHHEHSNSYSKPKPHNEYPPPSYFESHAEHSDSYSKPKPHIEHSDSYSKPKPHIEHSDSYSKPKPHIEYSDSYVKPKPHIEHTDSYSKPKPHIEHSDSYSKPKPHNEHSSYAEQSNSPHIQYSPPSYPKPHIEHSDSYSKPKPHAEHKPHVEYPPPSYFESHTEHSSGYPKPKPHLEHPSHNEPSYSDLHTESPPLYSQPKPHHEPSSDYIKPIIIYTPSYSKPRDSYSPTTPIKTHYSTSDQVDKQYSISESSFQQTTVFVVDRDQSPYTKPLIVPSSLPKGEPAYYNLDTKAEATTKPTQYHIYLDNNGHPSAALLIEGRNPSQEIDADDSDDWSFNMDEVPDDSDVPEIPPLPSDPEALNEMPHPMRLADEDEGSRSLV